MKASIVTFKQTDVDVLMQLSMDGRLVFESPRPDVFAAAMHTLGLNKVQFRFFDDEHPAGTVQAGNPLELTDAFHLVEHTVGFETKALMQLIQASILLHHSPTLAARSAAVEAWLVAERALPSELVINSAADAYRL